MTEGEPRPVGRTVGQRVWGTWPRRVTSVVLVLVVGLGVVVGVDEHRRPGVFFDLVGARVWRLSDAFGDWEVAVENRLSMGEVARQIYLWDGVQRVAWPETRTQDNDRGRLDPQVGLLTVELDPAAVSEIGPYVARALEVCRVAGEQGLDLRVRLQAGEHMLDVRNEDAEALQLRVDYFLAVVEDPETLSAQIRFGTFVADPGDIVVAAVLLRPRAGAEVEGYLARWQAATVDYGLHQVTVRLGRE